MSEGIDVLSVKGREVKCELSAPERSQNLKDVIQELNDIIRKKNAIIEKQTEYIADLQEENHNLRTTVRMLSI